jgi:hypothetical protein
MTSVAPRSMYTLTSLVDVMIIMVLFASLLLYNLSFSVHHILASLPYVYYTIFLIPKHLRSQLIDSLNL